MKRFSLALIVTATVACAGPVLIDSQPGLQVIGPSGTTVTQAIGVHPAWQQNNPANPGAPGDRSAVWISWADTGYQGSVFQNPWDPNNPAPQMTVLHPFVSGAGTLNLDVWADDTAGIFLDGNELWPPKTNTNSTCSGQPVGCVPGDVKNIRTTISAGLHELKFTVYQTGTSYGTTANPFGLLYTGSVVPEPATNALIGGGILLIGVLGRRHRR